MSHSSLGKQSCLAWLITTETWASRARGWVYNGQVSAKGLIQSDSRLHLDKPSSTSNCESVYSRERRCFAFIASFTLCAVLLHCVSGLVHLNPSAAESCSSTCSHGHVLFRLTAQCKQQKPLLWVIGPFRTEIAKHGCNEDPSLRRLRLFTLNNATPS